MIENKKYYVDYKGGTARTIGVFFMSFIAIFVMFYGESLESISMWYIGITLFLIFTDIFILIGHIQIKRNKVYLYYSGEDIYLSTMFGSIKKNSMLNGYTAKENKTGIAYVVINNESGKADMLIGGHFKYLYKDIVELLESKKNSTS